MSSQQEPPHTTVDWMPVGSGLALVSTPRRARAPRAVQIRHIRVNGGYQPARMHLAAGRPVRLIFRREETAACSERVVFPDLGISAQLPAFTDVPVELPAAEPGTHPFTCQMGVLKGTLILDRARAHHRREHGKEATR
jgi:plastocyanin domain-containing protein